MTGFGQAKSDTDSGSYRIEIRGVNNRFMDLQLRLPRAFSNLEDKIKKVLGTRVSRGSVSVSISWDRESSTGKLTWDRDKVSQYMKVFEEVGLEYGMTEHPKLADLLQFSDFIKVESTEFDDDEMWKNVEPTLLAALDDFITSRETEGDHIGMDLNQAVDKIDDTVSQIEERAPERLKTYITELKRKISQLADTQSDPQRLAMETALMADRLDISEECTRMWAHTKEFRATLLREDPIGKRLNFLLQEINRESNTIASKANDTKISHLAVSLKELAEGMREQVQNIE